MSVASVTTSTSDDVNTDMTESAVSTLIDQMNSYWSAQSEGAVTIELAGYETRSLGQSSCVPDTVLSTEEQDAFGGQFANDAWIGTNTHLMVLTRESCGSEAFATVGGSGGELFSGNGVSGTSSLAYLLHEFGHNLGFEHADASICTNTGSYDAPIASFSFTSTVCPTTEYDDFLDIMGYTVSGATPNISSPQQILSGWLTDYATVTDATPTTTVTLSPLGGTTGTRAIRVVDPIGGDVYYVEYRAPIGLDATSAEFRYSEQCDAAVVDSYRICNLGNSGSQGIVRILRSLPFPTLGANGTTVMATGLLSGSSATSRNTRLDTSQVFTNYDDGFTITLNSVSETAGAAVTVSFEHGTTTTTSLAIRPGTQTFGTLFPATAQVQVKTQNGTTAAGTVALYDGSAMISLAPLSSAGAALILLPRTLSAGTHVITARFTPTSTNVQPSTSATATLTVRMSRTQSQGSARTKPLTPARTAPGAAAMPFEASLTTAAHPTGRASVVPLRDGGWAVPGDPRNRLY